MGQRTRVQAIAAVVVAVFAVGIWMSGDAVKASWLRYYAVAVAAAVFILWIWDRVIWHLSPIQRFFPVAPDVRGTWKGTLTTLWVDAAGVAPDPKTVYLVIRQTSSSITAALLTEESRSVSTLARIVRSNGEAAFEYLYVNKPRPIVEEQSRSHNGSASLTAMGVPVRHLEGRYWTDRNSRGELSFSLKARGYGESYGHSASLFEGA